MPRFLAFIILNEERISLIMDDIKISPKTIAPPIFMVVMSNSTNSETSLLSADCIVLKIVNPGTIGINPGIKNTMAGARNMYAASSEYKATAAPAATYGKTKECV